MRARSRASMFFAVPLSAVSVVFRYRFPVIWKS
jgi:hypothetical protein